MKTIKIFEKGERVYVEMEITKVALVGGQPQYDIKDPFTGEFLDNAYSSARLVPVVEEEEEEEDAPFPDAYMIMGQ